MPFDGANHLTLSVVYTADDFFELRATVNSKSDWPGHWAGTAGTIRLRFYAIDKSKHIACYCQLVEWAMEAAERNCLQVVLSIEAASLDEFIKQLRDLAQGRVDSASLLFE
jgi:hypothetical protein